jgi:hypothetical protein
MDYKGFHIGKAKISGYVITRAGVVITSQPSVEFAKKFIDRANKAICDRGTIGCNIKGQHANCWVD